MTPAGNQSRLNNGCVCDSGCESCDRLAEAFTEMHQTLAYLHSKLTPHLVQRIYTVLALADKVTKP